jgi:hypothetical protein
LTEFDEEPELGCALIFAELAGCDEGELTKLGCPVIFAEVEEIEPKIVGTAVS